MVFNILWTVLLGVIGGIISSLIVSRIFLIQGEYQQQIKSVDQIIRKLGSISAYLNCSKAIFEVSYDTDVQIKKEMEEKGYRCEAEFFAAHKDEDWISKKDVLELFWKEICKTIASIHSDLSNVSVQDKELVEVLKSITKYINNLETNKDLTFSRIRSLEKDEKCIFEQYDSCVHMTGRKLTKLVFKDKVMIVLFILVVLMVIGTVISMALGI